MADIILAGSSDESLGGVGDILTERGEKSERLELDLTHPEFVSRVAGLRPAVVLARFHEGDLASIKAMQTMRMATRCVQAIFITQKPLSAPILTLMFNEGAFGVLQEPLDAPLAWQLIRQAIKRSKWERDEMARDEELRRLNESLRQRAEKLEGEAARDHETIDRLEQLAYLLIADRGFKPQSVQALIVSNAEYQRGLLEEEFKKLGFVTHTAKTAGEAMPMIKKLSPDIVLSDLELSDMSGMEFGRKVKSEQGYPRTHFVIITSSPEKVDKIMSPETKVDDCVVKPHGGGKLYTIVARAALGLLER